MSSINLVDGTAIAADGSKMFWNGSEYQDHPVTAEEKMKGIIDWYENEKEITGRMYQKRFDNAITAEKVLEVNKWYEEKLKELQDKYIKALLAVK